MIQLIQLAQIQENQQAELDQILSVKMYWAF